MIGPISRRRKPEGKGGWGDTASWKFGSACPGGRALKRLPKGGQALPNLTRVKSGKKQKRIGRGWDWCLSQSPRVARTARKNREPEDRLSNLPVAG